MRDAAASCPRCGYALQGVADSWRDACPLEGTCSECGLAFEWADLLSSKRCGPRWCIEYGRPRTMPIRAAATVAATFNPLAFWRSLSMHHRPRWLRLAGYILILAAMIYVPFAAGQGWRAWRVWPTLTAPWGIAPPAPPAAAPSGERLRFVAEAIARPWARSPDWTPRIARCVITVPTPTGISTTRCISPRLILQLKYPVIENAVRSSLPAALGFPVIVAALMPVGFLTLPISLRQARVRWRHLVRIWIYGFPITLVPVWVLCLVLPHVRRVGQFFALEDAMAGVCFLALPTATFLWWRCAIHRHLRLAHASAVSGALLAMAVLAAMVLGYFQFVASNWGYVLFLRPGA